MHETPTLNKSADVEPVSVAKNKDELTYGHEELSQSLPNYSSGEKTSMEQDDSLSLSFHAGMKWSEYTGEYIDDDLTNLNWLQSSDLMKNMEVSSVAGITLSHSLIQDSAVMQRRQQRLRQSSINPIIKHKLLAATTGGNSDKLKAAFGGEAIDYSQYNPLVDVGVRPPYSFSCLIFLAIESSGYGMLPVRDIYSWIQKNYPFYRMAPSGWKGSIRHTLSLSKCFIRVPNSERKKELCGPCWCVNPQYRPSLERSLNRLPKKLIQAFSINSKTSTDSPDTFHSKNCNKPTAVELEPLEADGVLATENQSLPNSTSSSRERRYSESSLLAASVLMSLKQNVIHELKDLNPNIEGNEAKISATAYRTDADHTYHHSCFKYTLPLAGPAVCSNSNTVDQQVPAHNEDADRAVSKVKPLPSPDDSRLPPKKRRRKLETTVGMQKANDEIARSMEDVENKTPPRHPENNYLGHTNNTALMKLADSAAKRSPLATKHKKSRKRRRSGYRRPN